MLRLSTEHCKTHGHVGLEQSIKHDCKLIFMLVEVRRKAVALGTIVVAGAYRTGLVSYFINRDLFPTLTKVRIYPL